MTNSTLPAAPTRPNHVDVAHWKREATDWDDHLHGLEMVSAKVLERFAALAYAAGRVDALEQAAQAAEHEKVDADESGAAEDRAYNWACKHVAASIREMKSVSDHSTTALRVDVSHGPDLAPASASVPLPDDVRDAKRYRFLRAQAIDGAPGVPVIAMPNGMKSGYYLNEETADFAIDAAMGASSRSGADTARPKQDEQDPLALLHKLSKDIGEEL